MLTPPAEVKLVVLHWEGTLLDFGMTAAAGAYVKVFGVRGIPVSIATARAPMGLPHKEHIRVMMTDPIIGMCWRATFGRNWTMPDVAELDRAAHPHLVEAARQYTTLAPGTKEAATWLRQRGIPLAATTCHSRQGAAIVHAMAEEQGFEPDVTISIDDVPPVRPAPWMIFRAMEATRVYPPSAVVKLGGTRVDVEDGRHAGAWSVGVVDASNEMGLTKDDFLALPEDVRDARRASIRERFVSAGAHAAINSLEELPDLITALNARLAAGEHP